MKRLLAFTLLILAAFAISCASAVKLSPIVNTPNGPVQGLDSEFFDGIYSFKGIPFALPPVGNLRFADPVPANNWNGVYNATKFSDGCMTTCVAGSVYPGFPLTNVMCSKQVSEDCLYLNVYSPNLDPNANLPVVVFIYGGDFAAGTGGVPLYDFSDFCKNQNVVGVTFNYRVGVFGALYNGGLRGNFHIKDQQLALKWVNSAIKNFGGDANNVMLAGQSAGGCSTWVHNIVPSSWNYFAKSIPMSNPLGIPLLSTDNAQELGDIVADRVGCPRGGSQQAIQCLRNVPADVMLQNGSSANYQPGAKSGIEMFMRWTAVVDGEFIPYETATAFYLNQWSKKPFMPTTVANESNEFVGSFSTVKTSELELVLGIFLGNFTIAEGAMLTYFPPIGIPPPGPALPFLEPAVTDFLFACPNRFYGRHVAKMNPNVPIYEYYFSLSYASWLEWTYVVKSNMSECGPGNTCHADDVPMIFWPWRQFTAAGEVPPTPPTQEEDYLHLQMQSAWGNFARTNDPNNATGNPLREDKLLHRFAKPNRGAFRRIQTPNRGTFPTIPRYDARDLVMNFSIPATIMQNYRKNFCDFWDVATRNKEGVPYRIA